MWESHQTPEKGSRNEYLTQKCIALWYSICTFYCIHIRRYFWVYNGFWNAISSINSQCVIYKCDNLSKNTRNVFAIIINTEMHCLVNSIQCVPFIVFINVKEYRRGNQKWTIYRHWQHRVNKHEGKQCKNTTLDVLDTTIRKQTQIT